MLELSLNHYLAVSAMLFALGIFGIFLNRKNVITILMSIELMLLLSISIWLLFQLSEAIWRARFFHYSF